MVSFVFQTKKKRERRGKRRERSHFFVERSLRMELERENAASYWKISRARSWREESTKHTLSARANYSRKERERERYEEMMHHDESMDRISTNDRCNRSTNLPRNTINPEEIWISLLPNGKSVDIPRIRVYIYIYIHSRLFDAIPFVERVLTYLEVFPRSQRLDPFVYRGELL